MAGRRDGRLMPPGPSISKEDDLMSDGVRWRDNYDAAVAEAKKENRPVILEFYMEG
jgi:hypothetical protein